MKNTKQKTKNKFIGMTEEEKAAVRERVKELQAEERMSKNKREGERVVLAAIGKMKGSDHEMGKKIHKIVMSAAPELMPRTWYGMPSYANKDGKVICFFQDAGKFKSRYATFGFSDTAMLDEGNMWPTSFALKKIGPAEERKIVALVKKAVS